MIFDTLGILVSCRFFFSFRALEADWQALCCLTVLTVQGETVYGNLVMNHSEQTIQLVVYEFY